MEQLLSLLRDDLDDKYLPTFLASVEKCNNQDMKNMASIIIYYYFQNNPPKKNVKIPFNMKSLHKNSGITCNLNDLPLIVRKKLYAYIDYIFN